MRSTRYNKWSTDERAHLFQALEYVPASPALVMGAMPKLSSPIESLIVARLQAQKAQLSDFYAKSGKHSVLYSRKVDRGAGQEFAPHFLGQFNHALIL